MFLAAIQSEEPDTLVALAFDETSEPHGGRHRSRQLFETISSVAAGLIYPVASPRSSRIQRSMYGAASFVRHGLSGRISPKVLTKAGYFKHTINTLLAANPKVRLLIIERVTDAAFITVEVAKARGCKVIILPQNIESLVARDRAGQSRAVLYKTFGHEIETLRSANAVFSITQEEQWLLTLFGVNAFYLPYFPPIDRLSLLARVKDSRRALVPRERFLLLGSAINPPSATGLQQFYSLVTSQLPRLDVGFDVAGVGTEVLSSIFTDQRFHVHGTVTEERLIDMITMSRALVINQPPTTGVLTRVIEAQLAGIPVIGNQASVAGIRDRSGIRVFRDAAELERLLLEPSFESGSANRPETEIDDLKREVVALLRRSD